MMRSKDNPRSVEGKKRSHKDFFLNKWNGDTSLVCRVKGISLSRQIIRYREQQELHCHPTLCPCLLPLSPWLPSPVHSPAVSWPPAPALSPSFSCLLSCAPVLLPSCSCSFPCCLLPLCPPDFLLLSPLLSPGLLPLPSPLLSSAYQVALSSCLPAPAPSSADSFPVLLPSSSCWFSCCLLCQTMSDRHQTF